MKHEKESKKLLNITRSKAKLIEYNIPEDSHIKITQDPAKLLTLTIGLLGDLVAKINSDNTVSEVFDELKKNLLISALFIDAYLQSRLNKKIDPYLILIGSASYYLCDSPGNAAVLAKKIDDNYPDLESDGLENMIYWLLQAKFNDFDSSKGHLKDHTHLISKGIIQFFKEGDNENYLIDLVKELRIVAYDSGTPRQLLFADIIAAIVRKMISNSSWKSLPLYSNLSKEQWAPILQDKISIKELWPSQHLLGKADIFKGSSAVIQMPTSAGKTKAIEFIIQSAFLSGRASLVIIIAPFRALCQEIKNSLSITFSSETIMVEELSDVMQEDFDITELSDQQQILVVTPEKLLYILRHDQDMISKIGLIIFDEGHQFDNGTRGITYELLLTSLRSLLSKNIQKVFISAVIINPKPIGEWLNGDSKVVEGDGLNSTFRSIGFVSWQNKLGVIEYVDNQNIELGEFFVPRVIESYKLKNKSRETKERLFPDKKDSQSIAIYLGLKLVSNGSVAIFCGLKATASTICRKIVENIERAIPFVLPKEFSNLKELENLYQLYVRHLGPDSSASKCASYGIFSHHGCIPQGIRLAVEYAMRENFVRFVVCTSTLAQGVNLPIRYLIITNVYQGKEQIKVRDFHNLIGRVGRAGMHTEGSILFADPKVYDRRKIQFEKKRWKQIKNLLEPENSEPCISNLLSIFDPIKSDDDKCIVQIEALNFVRAYINNPNSMIKFVDEIVKQYADKESSLEGVKSQVLHKINLISSIESFLLSHWDEENLSGSNVISLAEETLAYFLADEQKREHIRELFKLLADNIAENIKDPNRRRIYGRTLYGVRDAQSIELWVNSNISKLKDVNNEEEVFSLVWPLFVKHINNGSFKKFNMPELLISIAKAWINGCSYYDIFNNMKNQKVKIKNRTLTIDHVIGICEGAFAYDGMLLIGAVIELVDFLGHEEDKEPLINHLQLFQKQLKYGLTTETTIALYELGFSDRVIAQDLINKLGLSLETKDEIKQVLKENKEEALEIIKKYPSYFQKQMDNVLS